MITKNTEEPKGSNSIKRKRMTSTVTFRLDYSLKKGLCGLAEKQGHSLSSLIQKTLQDLLDSYEGGSRPVRLAQEEKRQHLRKEILLPARWRIRKGHKVLEHDVLVKNISVGGAYTEYLNGKSFQLFEDLLDSQLALVIRMPKWQEPVALNCKVRRIQITRNCVDVGLSFINISEEIDLVP
jgi:predicted transcriptional regulator